MDKNISMIRFLMFMILALIIFFNIAPQLVSDDDDKIKSYDADSKNESDKEDETEDDGENKDESGSDIGGTGLYCLMNEESEQDKVCKEISSGDTCQNNFSSLKECNEWKTANEYEKDDSSKHVYKTDDIDKKTIMTSDDMIYCLKNDKGCEQMKFGDCHDIHIGTYLNEDNCEEAKENLESTDDSSSS